VDSVIPKLDELAGLVESARAMPMSASCVVNRADVLGLIEDLRGLLPEAMSRAQIVLADKEGVVDEGRRQAAEIVAEAREERLRMLSELEVVAEAQAAADRLLAEAQAAADAMRAEVEDYVDSKLANFEIVLTKTLAAVERGREKLSGRTELDAIGERDVEAPLPD
jgi:cell division septum initiation protein DivIVA